MASTDSEPTTPTREPISITITDIDGGTLVWTPGEHGQTHLQEVPEEDLPRVIEEVTEAVKDHIPPLTGAICGVIKPEIKDQAAEMLIAMALLGDLLGSGAQTRRSVLSDPFDDDPFAGDGFGSFGFGFPRGF